MWMSTKSLFDRSDRAASKYWENESENHCKNLKEIKYWNQYSLDRKNQEKKRLNCYPNTPALVYRDEVRSITAQLYKLFDASDITTRFITRGNDHDSER
jgi:hypothetical protein